MTAAVVEQVESMIAHQIFPTGELLPSERQLAAQLGVSRNVVREALSVLSYKGLVRVEQGRGALVTSPTVDQVSASIQLLLSAQKVKLLELSDARLLIEPQLARLAARNSSPQNTKELTRLITRLHSTRSMPTDHVEADSAFHREIAKLSQQSILGAVLTAIQEPLEASMSVGTTVENALLTSDNQHVEIHDAIVRGDEEGAAEATYSHLQFVRTYISKVESNSGIESS